MSTEMATETDDPVNRSSEWLAGGVSGFLAGIPFGLMIQFLLGAMPAIGAMYAVPGTLPGWIAHLVHSVLFGLVFVAIVRTDPVSKYAERTTTSVGFGLVYGAVLWAGFIVFVWPIWLNAVGFPMAPSVPNVAVRPLIGHLVYGGVLGALYPWTNDWLSGSVRERSR